MTSEILDEPKKSAATPNEQYEIKEPEMPPTFKVWLYQNAHARNLTTILDSISYNVIHKYFHMNKRFVRGRETSMIFELMEELIKEGFYKESAGVYMKIR